VDGDNWEIGKFENLEVEGLNERVIKKISQWTTFTLSFTGLAPWSRRAGAVAPPLIC